jgi:two-component system OmpR family response regulator
MRVLLVEDNEKLVGLLQRGLRKVGMVVDATGSGEDTAWMATGTPYDVIVLDVMLPGADGFDVCRRLRADDVRTPILMLTARSAVRDRIAGLEAGADDYLPKPFVLDEFVARLRALARRGPHERPATLEVGDLRLDPATRRAWRGRAEVPLTAKPFLLLEAFMQHPGQVLSRVELLDRCWDNAYENRSNVVDVHVKHLREQVDRPFDVESIETVRGVGYRLRSDGGR